MPNGHIEQYLDAIRRIQRERIRITKDQQKQIAALYREIAADLEQRLKKYNPNTLGYRWLDDYAKVLRSAATDLTNGIVDIVTGNMLAIATSVVQAEMTLWSAIAPGLSERFSDVFSSIPQSVVNELLSGGIYKDFRGLSERLWNYQGKFDRDIQYIINQGILAQKSAYDIAKDLERYLNPSARKPFDWSKVYPGVYKTVDYNAQRLARTSITHAYQLAFQRATKDNPFVEKYKWLASNGGRVCPLCASRDGQLFDKDAVPLDHPNGMCTLVAVIPKSYDQIAEELADWANGGDNPALDKWLYPSGKSGIINTGAKKTEGWQNRHADLMYEEIRHRTTDVKRIAQNTPFTEKAIRDIKEHMFIKEHHFADGSVKRFDSDFDQVQAWDRLTHGNGTELDLIMLRHEFVELTQMKLYGYDYETAHEIANRYHNWAKKLIEEMK